MGTVVTVEEIRVEQIGVRDVEIETRKKKIFEDLNKAIDKISKIPDLQSRNGKWNRDLSTSLSVFFQTYLDIKKIFPLQYDRIRNYQREAGQQLSESKSTSVICKVIMEGLKIGYRNKEGNTDAHQFEVISKSLLTLMNYSDCTPEVTCDIAGEPNFLETMKGTLTRMHGDHMLDMAKDEDEKIMKWCLTIYYNISIVDNNIPRLCSLDIVPVFCSFLAAKVDIYRLTALAALANIINEKESTAILQEKADVIIFLLNKLGLALDDPHHRDLGWSAQECARTVGRLAKNDANKKFLVQNGCLPHLVELAKTGNVEEQREAVGAIQTLAFEKENHIKILYDTKLNIIDLLLEMKENSTDKNVREAVDGTFWNLRQELKKNDMYKDIVSSLERKNRPATAAIQSEESPGTHVKDRKGHILISYQQDDREVLIQIRRILEDDYMYVVCMNNDNTIEVMAKAVEEAHVILMCMSRKYKNDSSCQAEAEYAFQLKKKIVPLKMEGGYQADGWLGFIVGSKLFFDFSGKYSFEKKTKELIHEIDNCYKDEDAEPKVVPIKS